ncbi:hypothetical protein PGT21_018269 [Puccinia graminis f. sp. tritici]|uniref:Uncharacterized protein n=1 Tax=Puccinia graminis f. sp. tritici TaxID=56615 RepID=A0A5B0NW18_PUCGR|nr:hypothetical protein PGT21_018269 [Puccinia graminis f. sp. tritici]KAA1093421.1 hypothetical protein PGTUg99_011434 [Puccinia graminis f. sp. tritici]
MYFSLKGYFAHGSSFGLPKKPSKAVKTSQNDDSFLNWHKNERLEVLFFGPTPNLIGAQKLTILNNDSRKKDNETDVKTNAHVSLRHTARRRL